MAYMGKIILKRQGQVVHRESRTFDRKGEAKAWIARRETEIRERGLPDTSTLADAIDLYVSDSRRPIARTKAQVLAAIRSHPIAHMQCASIRSQHVVDYARFLAGERQPQTVGNYLSHLSAVFAIAGPAWGLPLDAGEMRAARTVAHRLGLTSRSTRRERRPTPEEIDRLLDWFRQRQRGARMDLVVRFAISSTRRQEEIVRIRWADVEPGRVLVRSMKHPGGTIGNDVWCDLTSEAEAVLAEVPRVSDRVFPYSTDAVSAAFTRACRILGIEDLRFHDLRHEGISRLFEAGHSIPRVASVSGHRSWSSLQRYTHIRHR